jgi:hypothetical protein
MKRLARLNREEDRNFCASFEFYYNNVRKDSNRACNYAWRLLQKQFPRLKKYQGAYP